MEFDIFLPVMRIVEAADYTDDAESDEIFRTGLFGSPIIEARRSFPMFAQKICPKNDLKRAKVQLGMRLVARLGAFVQIVGSHCTRPPILPS